MEMYNTINYDDICDSIAADSQNYVTESIN